MFLKFFNLPLGQVHVLSYHGQSESRTEYFSIGNGRIKGAGVPDAVDMKFGNSVQNLGEIKKILAAGNVSLLKYVFSGECSIYRITVEHFQKRMLATWKLMVAQTLPTLVDLSRIRPDDMVPEFDPALNNLFLLPGT